MFFFLKDLGQFSLARDASVAADDVVDVSPVFGQQEKSVILPFRKRKLGLEDVAGDDHVEETFLAVFMNHNVLGLAELEGQGVAVEKNQLFLG